MPIAHHEEDDDGERAHREELEEVAEAVDRDHAEHELLAALSPRQHPARDEESGERQVADLVAVASFLDEVEDERRESNARQGDLGSDRAEAG